MLKAIWINEEDEDILCEAMLWYQEYIEGTTPVNGDCTTLYNVRELSNRLNRGRAI